MADGLYIGVDAGGARPDGREDRAPATAGQPRVASAGRGERHQACQHHRPVRPVLGPVIRGRDLVPGGGRRGACRVALRRLLAGRQILARYHTVIPDQGRGAARGKPAVVVSPGRIAVPPLFRHAFYGISARIGQQGRQS